MWNKMKSLWRSNKIPIFIFLVVLVLLLNFYIMVNHIRFEGFEDGSATTMPPMSGGSSTNSPGYVATAPTAMSTSGSMVATTSPGNDLKATGFIPSALPVNTTNPGAIGNYPYGDSNTANNYALLGSMGNSINSVYTGDLSANLAEFINKYPDASQHDPTLSAPNPKLQMPPPKVMPIYPEHDPKYDNPFQKKTGWRSDTAYQPMEDHSSAEYSQLTGLSNASPVYYVNDVGEGFCKFHKTNIMKLEEECNKLDNDTCASTTCCVLLGGQKCAYGDKTGPKMASNYTDPNITKRDVYYHMGKCYGNCQNKKYQYGAPLVPSNRCAPPDIGSLPKHSYSTPYLQDQVVQNVLPEHIIDDQKYVYSSANDGPDPTLIPNERGAANVVLPNVDKDTKKYVDNKIKFHSM
jgi:hypothetical protein